MSQRSPMNERYQKYTKPAGKTRKSAAAAKPKRPGAAPAQTAKTSGPKKTTSALVPPLPPEARIWRNLWWGMLGAAIVFSASAFLFRNVKPWNTVLLVIAYVLIFGGLAIDFMKVRPARQAAMRGATQPKKDAAKKTEKAEKDTTDDTASGDA